MPALYAMELALAPVARTLIFTMYNRLFAGPDRKPNLSWNSRATPRSFTVPRFSRPTLGQRCQFDLKIIMAKKSRMVRKVKLGILTVL